jgi:hypothetical protein
MVKVGSDEQVLFPRSGVLKPRPAKEQAQAAGRRRLWEDSQEGGAERGDERVEGGPPPRAEEVDRGGEKRRRRPDGTTIGEKNQEFLMRHILPGRRTSLRVGRQRPGLDDKLQQPLDRR